MGKKRTVISLFAAALLMGAFAVRRHTSGNPVHHDFPPHAQLSKQSQIVQDYVVYDFLFRKVARLREKTRELQTQGRIGQKPYFPLQTEAGLTEGQSTALEAIVFACRQQVTQQDEKAKVIINAFQSRFPDGKLPKSGSPPPPPELKALWEERNAIILRARDQIRAVFGEEEFARFDNYAKYHHGANTSRVTINPVNPKSKRK